MILSLGKHLGELGRIDAPLQRAQGHEAGTGDVARQPIRRARGRRRSPPGRPPRPAAPPEADRWCGGGSGWSGGGRCQDRGQEEPRAGGRRDLVPGHPADQHRHSAGVGDPGEDEAAAHESGQARRRCSSTAGRGRRPPGPLRSPPAPPAAIRTCRSSDIAFLPRTTGKPAASQAGGAPSTLTTSLMPAAIIRSQAVLLRPPERQTK